MDRSAATRTKALAMVLGSSSGRARCGGSPFNPVADVEKPAVDPQRRHRGLLARGGVGARASGGFRAGRSDLPDGCVHGAAEGRAARSALARRRLRRLGDPRARQLRRRRAELAQVREGAVRPAGARRRGRAREARSTASRSTGDDDLVFVGDLGGYLDARALTRRYKTALRRGEPAKAPLPRSPPHVRHQDDRQGRYRRVQEWMGHARPPFLILRSPFTVDWV